MWGGLKFDCFKASLRIHPRRLTYHDGERVAGEENEERVILVEEGGGRGSAGETGRREANACWQKI